MSYQNVNIDTDVDIEIDADEIVNEASETVVQIMNDNLNLESEIEEAMIRGVMADIDLSDAIQSTLKMHPEIIMGAIVEYVRKESQQQATIETLRGEVAEKEREARKPSRRMR